MYFDNCTLLAYTVFDRPFWIFFLSFSWVAFTLVARAFLHRLVGLFLTVHPGRKAVGNVCSTEGGLSLLSVVKL
jgi:hypothetical protein